MLCYTPKDVSNYWCSQRELSKWHDRLIISGVGLTHLKIANSQQEIIYLQMQGRVLQAWLGHLAPRKTVLWTPWCSGLGWVLVLLGSQSCWLSVQSSLAAASASAAETRRMTWKLHLCNIQGKFRLNVILTGPWESSQNTRVSSNFFSISS